MKQPLHVRELNRARDWYNPLRGLDIQRVVVLLEQAERGRYDELQKLNRAAEKRHPTLRALKKRRLSAIKKLDWDVKVPAILPQGVTAAQAEQQRKFLRSQYEFIENLPQAVEHLALAEFRLFSHLEKHHQDDDPSAPVVRLAPVPQWHWQRDRSDFSIWRYDAEARGSESQSIPVDPADFIIREVDDALCEIALLCFVRRALAKRNWTVFQEDYAIPSIFAALGENTPLDKVKEWLELVKKVTNNSRGALPPGSEITTLDAGNLDGVQFENFIKAEDSDLVLAGTSGLLTMLTSSTGMNDSQGDAHEQTFAALAIAEAAEISALMQQQFDKPILAREFPSQRPVAYFQLLAEDDEDLDALAERILQYKQAGFDADEKEISEKSGLKLTRAAAPVQIEPDASPAAALPNRAAASRTALRNREQSPAAAGREALFEGNSIAKLSTADRAAMKPAQERVAQLYALSESDPEAFAAEWRRFHA